MYLTMNRFKVVKSEVEAFETLWKSRDSHLKSVPGFRSFALMKGPEREDHVLYASHTLWEDEASFTNWTRSEAFRAAHGGAKSSAHMYLEPPELEIFEAVQVLTA
ncbi:MULTISPECIES: antibiotic biosynthesis monooxygenase family protein [Mameliella]|jgi:heme-degrading monooxygenase HmoA|uniref:Putative, distant similarity with heme-degrading oxygenase IsdG n=1 Tax=Mameliella alba TaxID=561184 RepID=A0A0B3RUT5_9RHOB|nr:MULTISPECIES: antibiotic biosynthesis monooxygenase [Mameliella]MBV6635836.1 antibiotic biosynthesis monooxygenase [Mameliella sp.]MCR9275482.1 antibiotic biosynthesis monooxygenase [Paracoccaceae bacterium]ODM48008.1 antibiotic biosynthesis monooxygenase [Ruegeria sp. PBVC088]KHQ50483.1 putative, distant similarity with heme-degrading oxygenase IsdG [Mameliella alba]MBY6122507.1 antibiotic biosynthesis monooxygenase [Mameliella alba]